MLLPILLSSALACVAPDDCDGDPGFVLTVTPPVVSLGDQVTIELQGPANEPAFLFLSDGQGPVDTAYGTICLDLPPLFSRLFRLDDDGKASISFVIPTDCGLDDQVFYLQFLV